MAVMREFCFKHQLLRDAGEQCGRCASEQAAPGLASTSCPRCGESYQHAHICSGKIQQHLCMVHQFMYWGLGCPLCDQELVKQSRETIAVLEARIADLESRLLRMARDLDRMQSIVLDVQRAQNVRAARVRPNEDLLP